MATVVKYEDAENLFTAAMQVGTDLLRELATVTRLNKDPKIQAILEVMVADSAFNIQAMERMAAKLQKYEVRYYA